MSTKLAEALEPDEIRLLECLGGGYGVYPDIIKGNRIGITRQRIAWEALDDAARRLIEKGYLYRMPGRVEGTYYLTEKGIAVYRLLK